MALSEFELIERFFTARGARRDDVVLGTGDDAAVLRPPQGESLVAAVDSLVVDVHFPADAPAETVGHKALAVNLSDLAAMGATPAWALLAISLPAVDERWIEAFATGFNALAQRHGVALVGGDTTRGALTVTVTVLGSAALALRRDGAASGDRLWVSGTIGDAAAGLACWQEGRRDGPARTLNDRLHRPTPRVELGRRLNGIASAAVDISDGLVADTGHIARRSGLKAVIHAPSLPLSAALTVEAGDDALSRALSGGDDYELCFTAPTSRDAQVRAAGAAAEVAVTPIGRLEDGAGVDVLDADGRAVAHRSAGYRHFSEGGA